MAANTLNYQEIQRKVAGLRVPDLTECLERLGLKKSGKKADLQARLLNYFEDGCNLISNGHGPPRDELKLVAAQRIIEEVHNRIHGHGAVAAMTLGGSIPGPGAVTYANGAPEGTRPYTTANTAAGTAAAAANGLASNIAPLLQSHGSGGARQAHHLGSAASGSGSGPTIIRCICGNNSVDRQALVQCRSRHCGVWQHATCAGIPQGSRPAGGDFFCELCRAKRADPFWAVEDSGVTEPMRLSSTGRQVPLNGSVQQVRSVDRQFTLSPALHQRYRSKQTDHQLQLVCLQLNDPVPFRFHWPLGASLEINNMQYRVYTRSATQKLGANGRDEQANIGTLCPAGRSRVTLQCTDNIPYVMLLLLARNRTIEEVRQMMARPLSNRDAINRVRQQLRGGDDDEVQTGATVVSLRCPLTGSRVRTPARFREVPGLAVFDLEAFLDSARRTRKWQCPISMNHSTVHSLQIDTYMQRIVTALARHPDVMEVEVAADGRWRPANWRDRFYSIEEDDPLAALPAGAGPGAAAAGGAAGGSGGGGGAGGGSDDEETDEEEELRRAAAAVAGSVGQKRKRPPSPDVIDLADSDDEEDEEAGRPPAPPAQAAAAGGASAGPGPSSGAGGSGGAATRPGAAAAAASHAHGQPHLMPGANGAHRSVVTAAGGPAGGAGGGGGSGGAGERLRILLPTRRLITMTASAPGAAGAPAAAAASVQQQQTQQQAQPTPAAAPGAGAGALAAAGTMGTMGTVAAQRQHFEQLASMGQQQQQPGSAAAAAQQQQQGSHAAGAASTGATSHRQPVNATARSGIRISMAAIGPGSGSRSGSGPIGGGADATAAGNGGGAPAAVAPGEAAGASTAAGMPGVPTIAPYQPVAGAAPGPSGAPAPAGTSVQVTAAVPVVPVQPWLLPRLIQQPPQGQQPQPQPHQQQQQQQPQALWQQQQLQQQQQLLMQRYPYLSQHHHQQQHPHPQTNQPQAAAPTHGSIQPQPHQPLQPTVLPHSHSYAAAVATGMAHQPPAAPAPGQSVQQQQHLQVAPSLHPPGQPQQQQPAVLRSAASQPNQQQQQQQQQQATGPVVAPSYHYSGFSASMRPGPAPGTHHQQQQQQQQQQERLAQAPRGGGLSEGPTTTAAPPPPPPAVAPAPDPQQQQQQQQQQQHLPSRGSGAAAARPSAAPAAEPPECIELLDDDDDDD